VVAIRHTSPYTHRMRLLHVFLIFWLCFAIPLQSIAGMLVISPPCPLESPETKHAVPIDKHACCNDADTKAKTGKACKVEKECHAPSLGLSNPPESALSALIDNEKIPLFDLSAAVAFPSAAWRPPNPS